MRLLLIASLILLPAWSVAEPLIKTLSNNEARALGTKIWRNESGCSQDLLIFWSALEPFPSLGIGHCIWFPVGYNGPYTQTFPQLIAFLQTHGASIPPWLSRACTQGCPWTTRQAFYQDKNSPRVQELYSLLRTTIDLQTKFMIDQCSCSLDLLINAANPAYKNTITTMITTLGSSTHGAYILVDYLNFKGSGLNTAERYSNQGWGLLQVMEYIAHNKLPHTPTSFAQAAEYLLRQRVANAPEGSPDAQRLQGWINRVKTYAE